MIEFFIRNYITCFRRGRTYFAAVMALLACGFSAAHAAPVTFRFEAIIIEIADAGNLSAQLPFQPNIGDPILGSVTFTPVAFGQISENDAFLETMLFGERVAGEFYKLSTVDDFGAFPGAPVDGLSISCGVPGGCADASFALPVFELSLVLSSFQDIVSAGEPMDAPESWNEFEFRRVDLVLSNLNDTVRMRITADVGPMRLVPEPSSLALLFGSSVFAVFLNRAR